MSNIAPALRLVAALRAGAHLVARPRSGVAHLYRGPVTSGCRVPRGRRVVCGARTRTLTVVELLPRRWCRRCNTLTRPAAELRTRDDWFTAFGHLAVTDVHAAALWSRTVDETHQVGMVARMLYGGKPTVAVARRAGLTTERRELLNLHEAIEGRRRFLATRERTEEERAAIAAGHEAEEHDRARLSKSRRDEAATTRAVDLAATGHYLTPWERAALKPDTSHRPTRSTRP